MDLEIHIVNDLDLHLVNDFYLFSKIYSLLLFLTMLDDLKVMF